MELPTLDKEGQQPSTSQRMTLHPLAASIVPDQSSYRVLSTKVSFIVRRSRAVALILLQIELKLAKAVPDNWSALLSDPTSNSSGSAQAGPSNPSSSVPVPQAGDSTVPAAPPAPLPKAKPKKNWDKLVDEADDGPKDPVSLRVLSGPR